jgi:lysophospholipase L1-like esterase
MPQPKASRTRRRLLRIFLVAALALLAGEAYLRVFRPIHFMDPDGLASPRWPMVHSPSDVPGLAYGLTPGAELEVDGEYAVSINSDGMRDEEVLPRDTPGLFRVAVLGDSIAFGWKVEADEVMTERLEARLNAAPEARGRVVEVLNFGVSGYSTRDEAILFDERVAGFEPDVVVLAYCMNDPESGPAQPLPRHFSRVALWQHSHLLRLVAQTFHMRRVRTQGRGDYYRYLHAETGKPWASVLAGFDRIRDRARALSIPVVVVVFPWMSESSWDQYPFADLHAQVARAASERGFAVVDLLDRFRAHRPTDLVFSTFDDPHPTVLGHEIASAAMAEALLPLLDQDAEFERPERP